MPAAPPPLTLTPEQWRRVQDLFLQAADLSAEEQAAFLDAACDDPRLRTEVEAMLATDAALPSLLEATPTRTLTGAGSDAPDASVSREIGPYRLLREVGRGGMGTVYLAERADVQKRVALKLVRGGLAAPEAVRRFLLERRVLARLEHPNIARLLDAGVAPDGSPYFAMEYVEGEPLTAYADARRLGVEDRLALFLAVGQAVAYAHRHLVVHRDLKPSNILVTDAGDVKLLDFGIAKLLEEDEEGEGLTRTGLRPMTPEYAAPEQVRGGAITTATDVYSLGVVLYELLAGRRPYDLADRSPGEVERVVCEAEPPRLSAAARGAGSARLARRLAGDLDTIVGKALAKEPERRYQSAEALTDDLRRHLRDLPIRARPDTLRYRARKFAHRHRAGVATAAALLAGIAGLVAFFVARLADERDAARLEAAKAEQVSAFLVDLFDAADPFSLEPERADTMSARTLLARGAARIDAELAGQPEVQAELLDKVGRVYTQLGLYAEADSILTRALELRRALHGDEHADVAVTLNGLGVVAHRQGAYEQAETYLREALALNRALHGDEHAEIPANLSNLGAALQAQGHFADAEAAYREALAMSRRLHGDDHPDVAAATSDLAGVLMARGDPAEAERLYREALALDRRLRGDDHPDVTTSMNNLAHALFAQDDLAGAEALMREVLARNRERLGDAHPYVALGFGNLGGVLGAQKEYAEAVEAYAEAVRLGERSMGADHPHVLNARLGLGSNLNAMGRPAEAEPVLRGVVARLGAQFPEGHPSLAWARNTLGTCLADLGRFAEAERLLLASHRVLEEAHGPAHYLSRRSFERVLALYTAWGRPEELAGWRARADAARATA